MSNLDVIRAWKDEGYRNSLSEAERALLPENPAGAIELTDADLDAAGAATDACMSLGCCPYFTWPCSAQCWTAFQCYTQCGTCMGADCF
ncbi:MAG: mersacidin/lichenicidin family type 2 lantibiotic [Chloroflexota bacterium]|nr:mersacidin/lichenicidin family type 2 lantibiotic [Chloroflexota bacterium]